MTNHHLGFGHHVEPLLIVISGPSGVGKDSVVQHMENSGIEFHFVITATSRPPRKNEEHGVDYFFYEEAEFKRMIEEDEFLEYAEVYGAYKGVPRIQVRDALASGKDVIMRLDVQGADTIRKKAPEAVLIFLTTNTEEELIERLKARQTENAEDFALRMETARAEYQRLHEFDYVVVNGHDQLDETVKVINSIITGEHHRVTQRKVSL